MTSSHASTTVPARAGAVPLLALALAAVVTRRSRVRGRPCAGASDRRRPAATALGVLDANARRALQVHGLSFDARGEGAGARRRGEGAR